MFPLTSYNLRKFQTNAMDKKKKFKVNYILIFSIIASFAIGSILTSLLFIYRSSDGIFNRSSKLSVLETKVVDMLSDMQSERAILENMIHRNIDNKAIMPKQAIEASITTNNVEKPVINEQVSRNNMVSDAVSPQNIPNAPSDTSKNLRNHMDTTSNLKSDSHPILFLNEQDFLTTKISTMMSWYGESQGGGSCSSDFGNSLVSRWRQRREDVCSSSKQTWNQSSMSCYLVQQTRHHGNGDNLCVMQNVGVDLKLYGHDEEMLRVIDEYVSSMHMNQPYVKFQKGFVAANCQPSTNWQGRFMPGWNEHWSFNGFQPNHGPFQCQNYVEDHNVLVVQRDTFANFFHDSEDFTNTFLALAILEWSLNNTQIYLTDLYPKGPFWSMWSKAFSGRYPALTSWDLRELHKKDVERTCFKNVAIGIYGPASPITVASWDTPCHKTALVRAYSDFIIRGFGLQGQSRYLQTTAAARCPLEITLTFLARRSSVEWPEKKFCDDDNSYFKCRFWKSFGIRKLGRMIKNEAELLQALKSLEKETFSDGRRVKVRDVDFNVLSLEQQIEIDMTTDIMVGPHGAGLMHNIFMPDRAALVELFIDGSGVNRHFHNLAFWYGRRYNGIVSTNPIDISATVRHIRKMIEETRIDC